MGKNTKIAMVKSLSNNREQTYREESVTPSFSGEISRVSTATSIKGEIVSNGSMQIDGNVEGKISCAGHLVVGQTAVIKGDIQCSTVDFCGSIVGNLYVEDTLNVKKTACIDGDINAKKMCVELGAALNGCCRTYKADVPASEPHSSAE